MKQYTGVLPSVCTFVIFYDLSGTDIDYFSAATYFKTVSVMISSNKKKGSFSIIVKNVCTVVKIEHASLTGVFGSS